MACRYSGVTILRSIDASSPSILPRPGISILVRLQLPVSGRPPLTAATETDARRLADRLDHAQRVRPALFGRLVECLPHRHALRKLRTDVHASTFR